MRQIVTTITQRGQVTVPAEVRRLLGLKPRDKVAFTIDDGQVRITPAFTLESAFRSVPPLETKLTDKEISRIARDEKVDRDMKKLAEQ